MPTLNYVLRMTASRHLAGLWLEKRGKIFQGQAPHQPSSPYHLPLKKDEGGSRENLKLLLFCQKCSSDPDSNAEKIRVQKREQRDIMFKCL